MEQKYRIGTDSGYIMWDINLILENITMFPTIICDVAELSRHNPFHGDEDYAMTTDISKPLIIVALSEHINKLIDGNHRLYKASRLQMKELPAIFLTKEEHIRFIENYDEQVYNHVISEFLRQYRSSNRPIYA